jgi:hypothetical protein
MEVSEQEEKRRLQSEVHLSGFGAKLDAEMAASLEKTFSKYAVKARVLRTNGPAEPAPCSFQELLVQWKNFEGDVLKNPQIIEAVLAPYYPLDPIHGIPSSELQPRADGLQALYKFYRQVKGYIIELEQAIENPDVFVPSHKTGELSKLLDLCDEQLQMISTAIKTLRSFGKLRKPVESFRPDPALAVQLIETLGISVQVNAIDSTPTDTGLRVKSGDRLEFVVPRPNSDFKQRWTCAKGVLDFVDAAGYPTFTTNDEGRRPDYPNAVFGRLVGVIGDSEYFDVGLGTVHVASTAGAVRLFCNDDRRHHAGYRDNDGSMHVRVKCVASEHALKFNGVELVAPRRRKSAHS